MFWLTSRRRSPSTFTCWSMTARSRDTSSSVRSRTRVSREMPVSSHTCCAVVLPIPKMYVSEISSRFSRGMSTPEIRAMRYPWTCLWRGLLLQMTRTLPWRLITLQCSHMRLTEGRTFIGLLFRSSVVPLPVPECDPAAGEVVRSELHLHLVARRDADVVHAHLPRDVGEHLVPVLELDTEVGIRQRLDDRAFHQDRVVL